MTAGIGVKVVGAVAARGLRRERRAGPAQLQWRRLRRVEVSVSRAEQGRAVSSAQAVLDSGVGRLLELCQEETVLLASEQQLLGGPNYTSCRGGMEDERSGLEILNALIPWPWRAHRPFISVVAAQ
jgi:hypothetical protein